METNRVFVPPGGPLEVVFSFDTTSSMYGWLSELRGKIQDMIQRLLADIPGIRMAVFAHGDYCDAQVYVTKWIDFSNDIVKLCDFVKNVEQTGGGDVPECYELVLRQVRTELSWTPGSRRVLVMIGDSNPHEPNDACNKDKIDWRTEVKALAQEAVIIYGVQCGHYVHADTFYKAISLVTEGKHLRLADFSSLFDTLMAVCYREGNDTAMLANYEKEVRARGGCLAADIDAIFTSLRNDNVTSSFTATLAAVKPIKPLPAMKKEKSGKALKPTDIKVTGFTNICINRNASDKITHRSMKSRFDRFKECNLPLLKRENVPENNFGLRSLHWYPWTLAMVSSDDLPKDNIGVWEKRFGRPGYRLKNLSSQKSSFAQNSRKSALFEVAVQGSGVNKKRYVVFSAFSSRCFGVKNWERRLLRVARSQVDLVLKTGGRVYVRFCFVESKALLESSKRNIRRYDYAWRKVRTVRPCPRDVVKGSVIISKSES